MRQNSPTSAARGAWSYKAGEKGRNRVRVFDWPGKGLWIDYRDGERRIKKPLGYSDQDRAKRQADEIAARLGQLERIEIAPAALTLRTLFEMYEGEVTPQKGASAQLHDRRTFAMALRCWKPGTPVASLDRRDWDRFIAQRRNGTLSGNEVRDGTIHQDLATIRAVMHWAETVRVASGRLLERNPFDGFPMPAEASPRQPDLSEEEFQQLLNAAPQVDPRCPLYLILVHETGHRMNAIAKLRWSDVDLARRTVRWRAESEKTRREHRTPLSAAAVEALRAGQRQFPSIGDTWIFPAPRDASKAMARENAADWWVALEQRAGLARVMGRGWHSLRRKFATEHMDIPLAELMALGGWKNPRTILTCYQKPREDRLREALERRSAARTGTNGK